MSDNQNNSGGFGSTAERMMEFGIGMSMAGQMNRMMNQAMNDQMYQQPQPRQGQLPYSEPQRLYYAVIDGRQAGPFSEAEIGRLLNEKRISRETLIWHQGLSQWQPAQDVPEIMRVIVLSPPPL